VDNGSADDTLEVFRTMAMRAGDRRRYVSEPVLGKSRALNAGIAVARGAVVALIDDDVSPAVDWVATIAGGPDKARDGRDVHGCPEGVLLRRAVVGDRGKHTPHLSSRLSSCRNRQSVPWLMMRWGVLLITRASCNRRA
jgi:glycosyltransferase involved in cell wall biosynthesis